VQAASEVSTVGKATTTEVPRLRNSRRELAGVATRSESTVSSQEIREPLTSVPGVYGCRTKPEVEKV
jgi:hypothetical protein